MAVRRSENDAALINTLRRTGGTLSSFAHGNDAAAHLPLRANFVGSCRHHCLGIALPIKLAGDVGHELRVQGVQRAEPPELHVRRPNLSLDNLLRFVTKPLHVTLGDLKGCLRRF